MKTLSVIGKFLDQPLLTANINKKVPYVLASGSGILMAKEVKNKKNDEKIESFKSLGIILASTCISAMLAPKIASFVTKREVAKSLKTIQGENEVIISEYSKTIKDDSLKSILNKAKRKILSLKEIKTIFEKDESFANKLIPPPENIQSNDIFKEIGWLSIYGAVPVAGGITGGVIADKVNHKDWKINAKDKINEGIYQYLANIFLCNIGAGVALGILEKLNLKSKMARCIGMVCGILATGVIGGSFIANLIGNKLINPLVFNQKEKEVRTPEVLDLTLHTDDIATVSLLSGLKWIEPSLPILYSISGYRAGIGYRNNNKAV